MTATTLSIPIGLLILLTFFQALVPSIMKWNYAEFEDGTKAVNKDGMGPRDKMPKTSIMVGRAERAKANLFESLLMFTPALAFALFAGGTPTTLFGDWMFLAARLAYVPCYVFAVLYVRSAVWTTGLVAIAIVWWSAISA